MTHEERFDRIDANVAEVKQLAVRVEDSLSRVATSASSLEGNISSLAATVAATAANLDRLTQFVLEFRGETVRQLEIIDNRLTVVAANLNNIEARFPTITKAIMDFGKETTHLHTELSRHRTGAAELGARIDRLEEHVSKLNPAA